MTFGWSAFSSPLSLGAFVALFSVAGFLVLWYDAPDHPEWRRQVHRLLRSFTGRDDLAWVDARLLSAIAAAGFALGAATTWTFGGYGCRSQGPSDLTTLVASGRALLAGGNPFTITACGHAGNPVPAGLASVLLDALGSLGGAPGVLVVWGAVATALVALVWACAPARPGYVAVFVLASFLYFPIVAVQLDGASLALVPVTVLLAIYLGRRGWVRAGAVGGFLATGRFPAVFPVLAATGRAPRRGWLAFLTVAATFAAVTAATFVAYGSRFTGPVFFLQFGRSHFALNYWGFLEGTGLLYPSTAVTVAQVGVTATLVLVCFARARTELGAASILLTSTVLLAQFLSFTELVFLIPVALVGSRARWWLWAVGVVAATNYLVAMRSLYGLFGPLRLSYALDLLLTAVLVGLLVELVRSEFTSEPGSGGPPPVAGSPAPPSGYGRAPPPEGDRPAADPNGAV